MSASNICGVSVWLLAPAVASVVSLVAVVLFMRLMAEAVAVLRDELRRLSAAAIAGEELVRAARAMSDHAVRTRTSANRARDQLFRLDRRSGGGRKDFHLWRGR